MIQKEYRCQACGAEFESELELERHKREMHSQYRCEVCGKTFSSERELETHNRIAHPENTAVR